jgi:acyl-CoA thioesterase-2
MEWPDRRDDLVTDFTRLLDMAPVGEDRFVAGHIQQVYQHLYGGQLIAQALRAAELTVDGRAPHALHGFFLRAGDSKRPLHFAVAREFDGRSLCHRRVIVSQDEQHLFTLHASFQSGTQGFEHSRAMPDVPAPEDLPEEMDALRALGADIQPRVVASMASRPYEVRVSPAMRTMSARASNPANDTECDEPDFMWFRARAPLLDEPGQHRALIAYICDYQLMATAMKRHGLSYFSGNGYASSIDHAMWFHQPEARADQWLLYVTDSPWARHGRSLASGSIYTRDGVLVASAAQEGLVRPLS